MILDDEEAKAAQEAQEVAKATGKGIDASRELGGFLNTVCGEALTEFGGAFKDWAACYRFTNMLKLRDKVEAILKKRRLEGKTKPIPLPQAIPLLEVASLENNESLQDMWARLISNATDIGKRLDIKKVHIDILSKLEPLDVEILNRLEGMKISKVISSGESKINYGILIADLCQTAIAPAEEILFSLHNLSRLGCIEPIPDLTIDGIGTGVSFSELKTIFKLTVLGRSLLEACKE